MSLLPSTTIPQLSVAYLEYLKAVIPNCKKDMINE